MSAPNFEHLFHNLGDLIEFEVMTENFNANMIRTYKMWSVSLAEAATTAFDDFERDGWYVSSITRVFDDEFFEGLSADETFEIDATFFEMVRNIDSEDSE